MNITFKISSLAPSICRLMGISALSGTNELLPFDYSKRPDRLCLITVDSLGVPHINSGNMPFVSEKFDAKKIVAMSELPCFTAVNIASMASGLGYDKHNVLKKGQELNCNTFLDIMKRCALKIGLISYKDSTLLNLLGSRATNLIENYVPQDVYTKDLLIEQLNKRYYDFIWVHFMDIDKTSHRSSPQSEDTKKALRNIDNMLKEIAVICNKNNYMLIINADHGQHAGENGYGVHDGSHCDDLYVPVIPIYQGSQ